MEIGSQQYFFIQNYGDGPDYLDNTIEVLSKLPMQYHEMASTNLFDEQTGLINPGETQSMQQWSEALSAIDKKVIAFYFNFPAVQVKWTDEAWQQLDDFLNALKKANPNLRFISSNPVPLSWADPAIQKSDEQLDIQLKETLKLAKLVKSKGLKLAYHFHAPELMQDARELRFMVDNIPSEDMGLIIDTNWCTMADTDPMTITRKYLDRIAFMHLRSSHNKIWDETLEDGEEKNSEVVSFLVKNGYKGPWIIEISEPAVKHSSDHAGRWIMSYKQLKQWIEAAK